MNTIPRRALVGWVMAVLVVAAPLAGRSAANAEGLAIPAAAVDSAADLRKTSEVAVLAGGCFWGVQGVFQHVTGVTRAVSGYAGGEAETAQYPTVGTGSTGHAESVQITFDPRKITFGKLLQIYFAVAHDPTQKDRQGPDVGTQYRSAIFPTSAEQARIAAAYVAQLNRAHVFREAIATTIEPNRTFYPAEPYHQDFLTRHPNHPYIMFNDLPKIGDLKHAFPGLYRDEPVLVSAARP